jgi:hypothetical protein
MRTVKMTVEIVAAKMAYMHVDVVGQKSETRR